ELLENALLVPGNDLGTLAGEGDGAEVERFAGRPGVDVFLEDVADLAGFGLLHRIGRQIGNLVELVLLTDDKVRRQQLQDESSFLGTRLFLSFYFVGPAHNLEDEATFRGLHLFRLASDRRVGQQENTNQTSNETTATMRATHGIPPAVWILRRTLSQPMKCRNPARIALPFLD